MSGGWREGEGKRGGWRVVSGEEGERWGREWGPGGGMAGEGGWGRSETLTVQFGGLRGGSGGDGGKGGCVHSMSYGP